MRVPTLGDLDVVLAPRLLKLGLRGRRAYPGTEYRLYQTARDSHGRAVHLFIGDERRVGRIRLVMWIAGPGPAGAQTATLERWVVAPRRRNAGPRVARNMVREICAMARLLGTSDQRLRAAA